MATCKNDDRPPDQKSKFFIEIKAVGLSARRKTSTSLLQNIFLILNLFNYKLFKKY